MAGQVQFPEKELRFTRSGQAVLFCLLSAILTAIAVTMVATSYYRDVNPLLPHPAWSLVPMLLAVLVARLAVKLTRHAYLILTPLGIEIFPFFRPVSGMQMVVWQGIAEAEVNDAMTWLTLHHDAGKTSGIHLSLRPVRKDRREILAKVVIARVRAGSEPQAS